MRTEPITSIRNPKIKEAVSLGYRSDVRRERGLFLVEGRREVERCLAAGFNARCIFWCPELLPSEQLDTITAGALPATCKIFEVPAEVYAKIAYRGGTEGIIAEVEWRERSLADLPPCGPDTPAPLIMVLESVEKPGNLGAVLRSADAAGASALLVCDSPTDIYNPNVIRASVGAVFTVPVICCSSEEAIKWLKDIPKSFYENRGYAVYVVNRSWQVEPWLKRQYLKQDVEYSDTKWSLSSNPKLTFAQEMQKMEGEQNVLSGDALAKRCYALAVRYAQAHFRGDCWWLMRDAKSSADEQRDGEADLAQKAVSLLQKASLSKDAALKERALFALCYGELYKEYWYKEKWNNETYKYDRVPDSGTLQFAAFKTLSEYEASRTPADYVSRCDEFKQFKKHFN